MAFADLLRRRRFVVVAIAGGVVGALIGLFLPIRAADPVKSEASAWSLPNAQALRRYRDEHYQTVRRARFWGDLAMPGRPAANPSSAWQLHAIVTRPVVQVAVSANGKPGQAWVGVGGALPDGSTLMAVSRDRVWFEKDACRRARALYQDKTKPESDSCIRAIPRDDAISSPAPPAPAASAGKPQ